MNTLNAGMANVLAVAFEQRPADAGSLLIRIDFHVEVSWIVFLY